MEFVVPSTKYQTNITVALFWDYALSDYLGQDFLNLRDSECELAVLETNSDPNILPHTFVNILRVNSWDPDNTNYDSIESGGGYTALQAMDIGSRGGDVIRPSVVNMKTDISSIT
ncbi:hypothetical protein HDU76_012244 [Blyttiomyces sp. JEL0837]|nr:hypothetical protein HDU76_012244 [Blyttiomyces sp. JEL0837]